MPDNPTSNDIDLESFLKLAGQSFTDAQRALVSGLDIPVNMMLSNAELELRVAVGSDTKGKISIRPISSEDIIRGGIDPGLLSTIRVSFISSVGDIVNQPVPAAEAVPKGDSVPSLAGLALEEAARLLKSEGWQFEPHAAGIEEIVAAGKNVRGRILRQQPSAGQAVDKKKITIHMWADLGTASVQDIDGIGTKFGANLTKVGLNTIGELSLATSDQVASALRVSKSRAQNLVDMAGLMSRLAVLGFRDEVVEILVKGVGIRSMEQLADSDQESLFRVCQEALASKKVQVPRGFRVTTDNVKSWIDMAASYLGK